MKGKKNQVNCCKSGNPLYDQIGTFYPNYIRWENILKFFWLQAKLPCPMDGCHQEFLTGEQQRDHFSHQHTKYHEVEGLVNFNLYSHFILSIIFSPLLWSHVPVAFYI